MNWLNLRSQKQNLDLVQTETLQFRACSVSKWVEPPQGQVRNRLGGVLAQPRGWLGRAQTTGGKH